MTRPIENPAFANDATFVAPALAWNGQPTKVAMPDALKAEGYEPNQAPAAEHFNWLMNLMMRWVTHLRDIAYQNWFATRVVSPGAMPTAYVLGVVTDPLGVWVYGLDTTGSGTPTALYSPDGKQLGAYSSGFSGSQTVNAAVESGKKLVSHGSLLLAITNQGVWRTAKSGANWLLAAVAGTWHALHSNGTTAVMVGDTGTIRTSTDGITWTTRTSGTSNRLRDVTFVPPSVTYPSGVWVVVGNGGVVRWSSDAGVSWSAATSGTSRDLSHVIYSATQGQMLAFSTQVSNQCVVLRSADGVTWTTVSAVFPIGSKNVGAVAELDGLIAYLSGGSIVFTPNGTTDWTSRSVETLADFQGLALSNQYGPFAVGTSGWTLERVIWNGLRTA